MASDVKCIKITTDMFDNRKIKHLRRLPDGNNIVLIWVMLLTMAGRCNANGMVFLTENIPYTPKMLADELDFEETTVQLALNALQQLNMIVTDSGFFSIAGWNEYQNIEGMEKIREQNRLRKAAQRERQKALAEPSQDSHVTSRDSHATDIDIDKEKEEEKELYISIISYLNQRVGANYRASTKKTKSMIRARLEEGFTLEDFKTVIDKKANEWLGTEYEQYLRPETLFGTKFESYLNANIVKPKPGRNQGYQKQTKADELNDFYNLAREWAEE